MLTRCDQPRVDVLIFDENFSEPWVLQKDLSGRCSKKYWCLPAKVIAPELMARMTETLINHIRVNDWFIFIFIFKHMIVIIFKYNTYRAYNANRSFPLDSHKPGLNKTAVTQEVLIRRFNQWTMTKGPKYNPLPKMSADDLINTNWYHQVNNNFEELKNLVSKQDLVIKKLSNTIQKNNETNNKEKKAAELRLKKTETALEGCKRKLDSQPATPINEGQIQRMIQTSEKKLFDNVKSRFHSIESSIESSIEISVSKNLEDVKPKYFLYNYIDSVLKHLFYCI